MNLIDEIIEGSKQMIGESIALNKDPMTWILFFAEISEENGKL